MQTIPFSNFQFSIFNFPKELMITNEEKELRNALSFTESMVPERIAADSDSVENGLAKLVLSIIELVRRLLEKQALRRMDAGNLTNEEIERMGNAQIGRAHV